ncbi:metallophosphoesterase family protein [Chondromyces apiculatus]|uniref:3',5'-cyclic-nucleotide phosphodiesterase n=1 Tax=Chondromyces apiculatus DSM 436 TaxID=1192034 RepID=A0A017T1W0_9BACT|nr:metallophosphoesterase [Chondromyces apiculatus]EYF02967.1 3',5'-cyclic-nucleotide phosphodiesterase [Chondromyces apiculatus DSM 436]
MRTLLHLSDLHFGRVDADLLDPLRDTAQEIAPDLVVVSGDLTQRAKCHEFVAARAFLDSLPFPQIVVPGNHDVPLYDVLARFFRGLGRYRKYITADLAPFWTGDGIAVLGVNTARALTIKDGRVSWSQIEGIKARMCGLGDEVIKVLVTHHPFDLPEGSHHKKLVGRAREALVALDGCGIDMILSGHLHVTHTGHSAERLNVGGHSTLIVQAGTATSTRGRGEMNSFNVVRISRQRAEVEQRVWDPETRKFETNARQAFERSAHGWVRPHRGHSTQERRGTSSGASSR